MENTVDKALNFLKTSPSFFREVLITIYGAGSLLFIFHFFLPNWIPEINSKISIPITNRLEINFLFILCSFLYGKLSILLSQLIEGISLGINSVFLKSLLPGSIFKHKIKPYLIEFKFNWKSKLHDFFNPKLIFNPISKEEVKYEISTLEIAEAMKTHPFLFEQMERTMHSLILVRVLFITSIIGFLFNFNYLIFSCLLFLLVMYYVRVREKTFYSLQRGIAKRL